ncbi:MAG: hypothetical protein ACK559_24910, partial [bacterium]
GDARALGHAGRQGAGAGLFGPLGHEARPNGLAAFPRQQGARDAPRRRAPEHERAGIQLERALEPALVGGGKLHRAHDHVGAREHHHRPRRAMRVDPRADRGAGGTAGG